jgi:hypothetical protein
MHNVASLPDLAVATPTITLESQDRVAPLTFVWNRSTHFSRKGG